jgi:hypothetical protein
MVREAEAADIGEVARMLRTVVRELPPQSPAERATARRIEGAALALATLAEGCPKTIVSAP